MLNRSIHHWPSVTFSENNKGARPWQKIRTKLPIFCKLKNEILMSRNPEYIPKVFFWKGLGNTIVFFLQSVKDIRNEIQIFYSYFEGNCWKASIYFLLLFLLSLKVDSQGWDAVKYKLSICEEKITFYLKSVFL